MADSPTPSLAGEAGEPTAEQWVADADALNRAADELELNAEHFVAYGHDSGAEACRARAYELRRVVSRMVAAAIPALPPDTGKQASLVDVFQAFMTTAQEIHDTNHRELVSDWLTRAWHHKVLPKLAAALGVPGVEASSFAASGNRIMAAVDNHMAFNSANTRHELRSVILAELEAACGVPGTDGGQQR